MVLLGIALYILAQLAIGAWVSRSVRTEDDYLLAGRKLGPVLASCSVFATWFGAESCVGAAGAIYSSGITRTTVEPFAYGLCLLLMGLLFAGALWRLRITTLADLLRRRYGPAVEKVAAILLIPTSVLWAAAQIRAFGHVLSSVTAFDGTLAIVLAAAIAIVYTGMGGMLADVVTDLVQGIALLLGLLVLCAGAIAQLGGPGPALEAVATSRWDLTSSDQPGWLATAEAWAIPVLGSLLAQEVVSRSLAARSPAVARGATIAGGCLYLAVGMLPVLLGLLGPRLLPQLDDPEQLLPELARRILSPLGQVLFAGALVSAILSTVDTTLLVAASLLSHNLVLAQSRDAADPARVRAARLGVAGFGIAACALALGADGVLELVEDASGFGSAGMLVIVSLGLCSRAGGVAAALGALLAGLSAWVLGRYVLGWPYPYLGSLAAALLGFAGGALRDRGQR